MPAVPDDGQWASFVRNDDELTLDKLSASEREEVFAGFGPEKEVSGSVGCAGACRRCSAATLSGASARSTA